MLNEIIKKREAEFKNSDVWLEIRVGDGALVVDAGKLKSFQRETTQLLLQDLIKWGEGQIEELRKEVEKQNGLSLDGEFIPNAKISAITKFLTYIRGGVEK